MSRKHHTLKRKPHSLLFHNANPTACIMILLPKSKQRKGGRHG